MRTNRSRRKGRKSKSRKKRSYRKNPRSRSRRRTRVKSYLRKRRNRGHRKSSRRYSKRRTSRRRNPFFGLFKKKRKSKRFKSKRRTSKRRYSSKRRRNPSFARSFKGAFATKRLVRGSGIVLGLGLGAFAKQIVLKAAPADQVWPSKVYGLLSIFAGAMLNMNARQPMLKSLGTGIVSYGILDLLISNVKPLAQFLPQIAGPSFEFSPADAEAGEAVDGGMNYGRSVMGANLVSNGQIEVVGGMGASLQSGVPPEIIGAYDEDEDDYGLDNAI